MLNNQACWQTQYKLVYESDEENISSCLSKKFFTAPNLKISLFISLRNPNLDEGGGWPFHP